MNSFVLLFGVMWRPIYLRIYGNIVKVCFIHNSYKMFQDYKQSGVAE